jgi:hypothetical protein
MKPDLHTLLLFRTSNPTMIGRIKRNPNVRKEAIKIKIAEPVILIDDFGCRKKNKIPSKKLAIKASILAE